MAVSPGSCDDVTVGERVRALRLWRHMTLAEVAGLVGVSPAYLSMAERGQRSIDRRSLISALATVLRVSETELTGAPDLGSDPGQSAPHTAIPALRIALEANSPHELADVCARPVGELAADLDDIKGLYYTRCDYVCAGERLPGVLDELYVHACAGAGAQDRAAALGMLVEACLTAAFAAKALGYPDLAHVAALRAEDAARVLGSPAALGKAAFVRCHTLPRALRTWDKTLAVAERAAGELEPHARDGEELCVLGLLTLTGALAAAVLQRGQVMEDWLAESARIAARVPDQMAGNWQSFSAANVAVWRTALAVERGEGGAKIAELAGGVDERKLTIRSRRADFLADVGRGVARDPKARAEAVGWLRRAEETAPQRVRNSAPARETVAYLLTRARAEAGGRELRGMAARMGVRH